MKTIISRKKSKLESILSKIIIPRKSAGKGNASKTLYKMRYGSDWKKYFPTV